MYKTILFRAFLVLTLAITAVPTQAQITDITDGHFSRGEELYRVKKYAAAYDEFIKANHSAHFQNAADADKLAYYTAMSAYESGKPTAEDLLKNYLIRYNDSDGEPTTRFALGNLYFGRGDYAAASTQFAQINPTRLGKAAVDEYWFNSGYAAFKQDNFNEAIKNMSKIGFTSSYHPHAQYVMGYSEYRQGDYQSAKSHFTVIADDEAYKNVVPYYLIQIEFNDGNYYYVRENGPAALRSATGKRLVELNRIIGESWFHTGGWGDAALYLRNYEQLGGAMQREEFYMIGFSDYMTGKYDSAERYLNRAAGPDDKLSQNASYHLADTYLRGGKKQQAMQSFAIASTPGYDDTISEDALFNYGKLQYELGGGYFNEAINVLNRYIETYPSSTRIPQVKEFLAAAYYNSKNYDAAYQAIMQVPNPDNNLKGAMQKITYFRALEYYNEGNYDEAAKLLDQSLQYRYNPKFTALAGYWQGELLYRAGNTTEAALSFVEYKRLSPKNEPENISASYDLGYIYFDAKDWANSKRWFDQFLSDYKENDCYRADALNRRGDIEYSGRSFWKAIDYYDSAAKLGTTERYYSALQRAMMLGMVQRQERKIESLLEIVRKEEGPYVADAMYELGRSYMGMQRYKEATGILERFITEHSDSPRYTAALNELGLAYQNLDNDKKALAYYKKVMEREKNSDAARNAMNGIRTIYVEDADVNGYFAYAKTVGVETDLGAVQRDSLAFVAAQKVYLTADTKRAATALDNYIKEYSKGAYVGEALFFAGENAMAAKDTEKAFSYYDRLVKMPNNDFTLRGLERLSAVAMSTNRYDDAAVAYLRLCSLQTAPAKKDDALGGYIKAVVAVADDNKIISAADQVLTLASSNAVKRNAKYAKATSLRKKGSDKEALTLYTELSGDVSNIEGAESAYRVIEAAYKSGDKAKVEKLVYALADKNTPHSYWLGKSFLLLGDVYAKAKDAFQARATYQSIVDGYPNTTDGIVADAKNRIAAL